MGRILTGFSAPYVAKYSASGTTVTYSSATVLARGVNVSVEAGDTADANKFYADNQLAESVSGAFTEGSVTLTVDGLTDATRALILGLPSADSTGWVAYGDDINTPYCGIGFVARYRNNGADEYVPYILTKAKFAIPTDSAATQEENIEWQTQELTATLMRDDTAKHNWKLIGAACSTEAEAIAKITAKLA